MRSDEDGPSPGGGRRFATTRWSLVQEAGRSVSPKAQDALNQLCQIYWPPVYAYIRCRGQDPEAARDLTQGFFTLLLEKNFVKAARKERGKFRSYLLTCVKRYMVNEWERTQALKRGGGHSIVSLDLETAESFKYRLTPADPQTPEQIYDKLWAFTFVQQVLSKLEQEMRRPRDRERFRALKPFLTGEDDGVSYKDVGAQLGMTEGAVKVAIHRLRSKFAVLLRSEVGHTLTSPSRVEEEIRFLLQLVS